MYYASNAYDSARMGTSALMMAYLWSTTDGNANWTVSGRQGHLQGMKPGSGKLNRELFLLFFLSKVYSTIAHSWL